MRKILLLFLSTFTLGAFGQMITLTPDPVYLEVLQNVEDEKVDMVVTNELSREIEFWWEIERVNVPAEWEFYMCDLNLCYTVAIQKCPCSKPNFLTSEGDGTLMVHIVPHATLGMGVVNLKLYDACDATTPVLEIPMTFKVDETSSTEFAQINNKINIFPNPALDYISLKNDDDVSEVLIYNIVGKKIKSFDHSKGESHDVSNLDKGIYLVRLLNKSNNVLKVLRLTIK